MNDNVVQFPIDYLSNRAKCLTCRHEWMATAPVGTTWLECPACSFYMGRFIGPVGKTDTFYHCQCGNDLFLVTTSVIFCGVCGLEHKR